MIKYYALGAAAVLGWLTYSSAVPTEPVVTDACKDASVVYEDGSCESATSHNEARWVYCVMTADGTDAQLQWCDNMYGAYDMGDVANVVEEFGRG